MIGDSNNSVGANSLKKNSINRILKDMIGETKKAADAAFVIIIVDDYTANILSSFLTMSEVLNEGIFSVERLGTKRQRFPKYHALYFISPTAESCDYLAKDFEEDSPHYSRVHVFFSHRIMDMTLERIVTQNLVSRVKTCKELNLSFLIKDRNLFDLGLPGALKIFTVKNNSDARSKILSTVMERLLTVCTVLKEFPYIQYQKNSMLCLTLAETLNANLNEFYQTKNYNEKRGVLLITDRTLDISTPLLHDYNYETMVYDLFKTSDNELNFNDKKYKLDEKDELWVKYKNKHMVVVFEELQKDFEAFMQSDLSKVNKADALESFDEMANVLHNMKGYKTKTNQFGLHLKLAEEITNVNNGIILIFINYFIFRNIKAKI
jgi:syntaxin-binding protein 1